MTGMPKVPRCVVSVRFVRVVRGAWYMVRGVRGVICVVRGERGVMCVVRCRLSLRGELYARPNAEIGVDL